MKNFVFLGPPGCGKGTQSAIVTNKLNYVTVSTGDLLRNMALEENEFGLKIRRIMSAGQFVGTEIVTKLIENFYLRLEKVDGCILDGYPRDIEQAKLLDVILENFNYKLDKVFYFNLDDNVIIKRIMGRYTCSSCGAIYNRFFYQTKTDNICDFCGSKEFIHRNDDNEQIVKERMSVYRKNTEPLLSFYSDRLIELNANSSKDELTAEIVSYLV